jgi:hypothetical protein
VTMADAHAQARKARRQPVGGTFGECQEDCVRWFRG